MKAGKLFFVCVVALFVCIISAAVADYIPASEAGGRPDWSNFGKAIWVTLLVTIPSFCIFVAAALAWAIRAFKRPK